MRVGSLFSGAGGFDMGFERAGFEIAWQAEIEPHACAVLREHWPHVPNLGDVSDVNGGLLEPVDVVIGGFPCQDLSVAGKRAGLESGARSSLFFQFMRIVEEMRRANGSPTFVCIENVPGLLSSNGGRDFAVLLARLAELGAHDIAWRVLDARHFGVPQRRRRVFLVVDLDGERAEEILFERDGVSGNLEAGEEAGEGVAGTLGGGSGSSRGWASDTERMTFVPESAPCLTVRYGAQSGQDIDQEGALVAHSLRASGFDASEDGTGWGTPIIAETVRSHPRPGSNSVGNVAVALDWQSGGDSRGLAPKPTAQLQCSQAPATMTGAAVRRLTPRECERLMGWPETRREAIIEVCGDRHRLLAPAESPSPRLQRPVGRAASEPSSARAASVGPRSETKPPSGVPSVAASVFAPCADVAVVTLNPGGSPCDANGAAESTINARVDRIAGSVRRLVSTPPTEEPTTGNGKAVSSPSGRRSTRRASGAPPAGRCSSGTGDAVSGAELPSLAVDDGKSTTSSPSATELHEPTPGISCCSVVAAIAGYIPSETRRASSWRIEVAASFGWTEFGVKPDGTRYELADGPRYRLCGNGVVSNVAEWIAKRMAST